ncbi:hypothetical protein FZ934_25140 (plasmid) [Rhizobium grahamii]|uniref:HNH endonuclease n=1 Tax=Rhizobium grahamii TaxID=1120045 RepID=A0A5Q0CH63_9HYPH|nr:MULTISPECIES: hypothetical protein [Rhizobium]QFY63531.1 hypothetical protein FZ934_25140 [Rhizobium grahamii]QRM51705.1 hypothetical protein F3Y33_20505 [Rhizobium sp. BG6]
MKQIQHDFIGQFGLLRDVAQNTKFPHHNTIEANTPFLIAAYKDYLRNKGNPWHVQHYGPTEPLSTAMAALYSSKIKQVAYIREIRKSHSGRCCSMCGSLTSTQVDHFLPQSHYPEFSIFKPNLFPICVCNQSKLGKTVGPAPGERFLHPLYDRKISDRAIYVRIRDHGDTPTFEVMFKKPKRVRDSAAFDFHTKTLVSKEGIKQHVKRGFEKFCRRPSSVVTALRRKNPESKAELVRLLCDEIEEATREHRTKNNWESVFLHALLERRTLNWIWRALSRPGRAVNGPLVAL